MRQKGTEQDVRHTDDQQDTGNHKKPATPETGGADRFGGTRTGAENVEGPVPRGPEPRGADKTGRDC